MSNAYDHKFKLNHLQALEDVFRVKYKNDPKVSVVASHIRSILYESIGPMYEEIQPMFEKMLERV